MVKILVIKKSGNLVVSNVKIETLTNLHKKCGFSSKKNFGLRHTWDYKNYYYSIFAKKDEKNTSDKKINKFDLPPPLDNELYIGNMVILKHTNSKMEDNEVLDISIDEFNKVYEHLFGGFDDIEESEEESEEEHIDPKNLTKHGYDKSSGFVVDDDDDDELDSDFSDIGSVHASEEEYTGEETEESEEYDSGQHGGEEDEEDEEDEEEMRKKRRICLMRNIVLVIV